MKVRRDTWIAKGWMRPADKDGAVSCLLGQVCLNAEGFLGLPFIEGFNFDLKVQFPSHDRLSRVVRSC